MPKTIVLDDATYAALVAALGASAPATTVPPVAPAAPAAPVAPKVSIGWHGDFRLAPATTPEAKNFNWLMETKGADYAFNYLVNTPWGVLGAAFRAQGDAAWGQGEAARVVNHYCNAGKYAPEKYNSVGRRICSVRNGIFSFDMGKEKITLPF